MANNPSPKHGSSPKAFPKKKDATPEDKPSVSQADGTSSDAPKGETQAQPQAGAPEPSGVGPTGEYPSTAGPGSTRVVSETPENRTGEINPSGPANGTEGAMTNMGSITEGLPENPNMNSFGEIGEPTGKGNIDIRPETYTPPEPDEKDPDKAA